MRINSNFNCKLSMPRYFSTVFSVFILLLAALSINSCKDEPLHSTGFPTIYGLAHDTVTVGDKVIIYGTGFGAKASGNKIIVDSAFFVGAQDCSFWSDSRIDFTLPDTAKSGKIRVIIGSDTTNFVPITVQLLPVIDMVSVTGGSFSMGSYGGQSDEMPVHSVTISNNLSVSRTEVTQSLYQRITGKNPSLAVDPALPVHNVSIMEAVSFCNKLSDAFGYSHFYIIKDDGFTTIDTSSGFRLPYEAEWEYCARAGSKGDFYNDPALSVWYSANSGGLLKSPGLMKPNAFGLYDMLGNVREYCNDKYSAVYYSNSPAVDPKGPASGTGKIMRGGSYADGKFEVRLSSRVPSDTSSAYCGIRLFRTQK